MLTVITFVTTQTFDGFELAHYVVRNNGLQTYSSPSRPDDALVASLTRMAEDREKEKSGRVKRKT